MNLATAVHTFSKLMTQLRYSLFLAWRHAPLTFAIGAAAAVGGWTLTLTPSSFVLGSAILNERLSEPLEFLWPVIYAIAGSLIVFGLLRPNRSAEAAGLVLVGFAVFVYVGAIVTTSNLSETFIPATMLTSLALAVWSRAWITANRD